MQIGQKAEYVKTQTNDGKHRCHWPTCNRTVPPAMWGCKQHWFKLPQIIRNKIWTAYVTGQEIMKNPSEEYMQAAQKAQNWIAANI